MERRCSEFVCKAAARLRSCPKTRQLAEEIGSITHLMGKVWGSPGGGSLFQDHRRCKSLSCMKLGLWRGAKKWLLNGSKRLLNGSGRHFFRKRQNSSEELPRAE